MTRRASKDAHDAWNPGLRSELPRSLLPLSTVHRPENSRVSAKQALELSDFTGLPPHSLVEFTVERLIIHELLIRVTADLSVSDGEEYEDLGRNFREMARKLLDHHIAPRTDEITARFEELKTAARRRIGSALSALEAPPDAAPSPPDPGWLRGLFGARRAPAPEAPAIPREEREIQALAAWRAEAETSEDALARACAKALFDIASAVMGRHGRLIGDKSLIADLAMHRVSGDLGADLIGDFIDPIVRDGAVREGFTLLPHQDQPVVMNVKGASASGKSTLRPLQKQLTRRLGLAWRDFALISPDIWRKFLLDYASLGEAYKYAGTLTGHEIAIIDARLDRYIARKAQRRALTHMLIDRFRFDSFRPETDKTETSRLLTRFGELIFLFFMVTPPEETVERAWKRGLKVGRYKAVDDLLDHNVEAFRGMPDLFLQWALSATKRVHFEFLDNGVAEGERPRTIAFGRNAEMVVLDVKRMLDVDRFKKVNIWAKARGEVYDGVALGAEANVGFLERCAQRLKALTFCDQATGRPYARVENGAFVWVDAPALAAARRDPQVRAGLDAVCAVTLADIDALAAQPAPNLQRLGGETIGAWGDDPSTE